MQRVFMGFLHLQDHTIVISVDYWRIDRKVVYGTRWQDLVLDGMFFLKFGHELQPQHFWNPEDRTLMKVV